MTDRFHIQKLAYDTVRELRISFIWEVNEQENNEIALAKELGQNHVSEQLENGDTLKKLLARSKYLLFKSEGKWTPSQRHRAEISFSK